GLPRSTTAVPTCKSAGTPRLDRRDRDHHRRPWAVVSEVAQRPGAGRRTEYEPRVDLYPESEYRVHHWNAVAPAAGDARDGFAAGDPPGDRPGAVRVGAVRQICPFRRSLRGPGPEPAGIALTDPALSLA